jgi:hypothetical protein
MKNIILTIVITFAVLGVILGGIIFLVTKSASGFGKKGECSWQSENETYKNLTCEGFVNKDSVITVNLKGEKTSEPLLLSSSAIKCSNKNGYFMCVGLTENCSVLNQKGPNFQAKCNVPFGPMEAIMNFDVGNVKIRWTR